MENVNYPPTQSDGMGFKPKNECKEQYIVEIRESNLLYSTTFCIFVV